MVYKSCTMVETFKGWFLNHIHGYKLETCDGWFLNKDHTAKCNEWFLKFVMDDF